MLRLRQPISASCRVCPLPIQGEVCLKTLFHSAVGNQIPPRAAGAVRLLRPASADLPSIECITVAQPALSRLGPGAQNLRSLYASRPTHSFSRHPTYIPARESCHRATVLESDVATKA